MNYHLISFLRLIIQIANYICIVTSIDFFKKRKIKLAVIFTMLAVISFILVVILINIDV